ncbi:MAG: hypothetical protein EpisKO_06380 [Epibacterium sp.]
MSLPYFPMFPSDFEAKTSHLTLAEDGAYNRLLRICWMTPGCSIPADEAWIMRRVRAFTEADKEAVRAVLGEFFTVENGRYSNAKLTRIWIEANDAHEKRKNAGSKGGKAKALKTKETGSSNAKAMPKQPEPEPEVREEAKASSSDGSSPHPANDQSIAVSRYNDAAEAAGWPKIQKLSPNRSRQLKARLAECGGPEGWEVALRKAFDSDFCRGRTAKPWHGFGFDWLIKSQNFTKLMEGNYDNRTHRPDRAEAPHGSENRSDAAFEQALRLAGLGQA